MYYGKLLKGRPVLVALDLFPAFYALVRGRQRARDYRAEYEAGRLSHAAKRLMDVLIRRHPLYTREWRAEALMLDPGSTRAFERAVASSSRRCSSSRPRSATSPRSRTAGTWSRPGCRTASARAGD